MQRLSFGLLTAAALAAAAAAAVLAAPGARPGSEKPDITSRGGLKIGTVLIPWGNAAAVPLRPAEAVQPGAQACVFNAAYEMTNLGNAAAAPAFVNRLRLDGAAVATTNSGLTLAAHETKSITASPYLPAGTHVLELSLDDDGNVDESNETNNRFKAVYDLKAPCGTAPAGSSAAGKK